MCIHVQFCNWVGWLLLYNLYFYVFVCFAMCTYVYSLVGICVIAPVIMCSICCIHFCNVFMCTFPFALMFCTRCVYFPRSCVYFLPPTCRDTSWLSEVETIGDIPVSASNRNSKPSWILFLEPSWRSWLSRSLLAPTCCAFELSTVENIFAAPPAKCDRKSSIELEVGCWLADIWISIFR